MKILLFTRFRVLLLTFLSLFFASFPVQATWMLDEMDSSIHFLSIKNNSLVERHKFDQISGSITSDGLVSIFIPLESVNTNISIRDERMRKLLFQTKLFPIAEFHAEILTDDLKLPQNSMQVRDISGILTLHGRRVDLKLKLTIYTASDSIRVMTNDPILINAEDFDLGLGILALRDVAGLNAISTIVPVTLDLIFNSVVR